MKTNTVKQKLHRGEVSYGTWLSLGDLYATRVLARMGFDWLTLDIEHSAVDWSQAAMIFAAVADAGCVPLARVPEGNHHLIKRVLDAGAWGIVVPMVDTVEQAKLAIAAAYYPPVGNRSVGGGMHSMNFGATAGDYYAQANDNILVVLQTESPTGVKNAEAIYSLPGVDAIFIGPNDLRFQMRAKDGTFPTAEEHEAAIQEVIRAGKKVKCRHPRHGPRQRPAPCPARDAIPRRGERPADDDAEGRGDNREVASQPGKEGPREILGPRSDCSVTRNRRTSMNLAAEYLAATQSAFAANKHLADRAVAQLTDDKLHLALDEHTNSIAVIMKHVAGNLKSRWTDFLTTDGEKPGRNRDDEFIDSFTSRAAVLERWEAGWNVLFTTLRSLRPDDLAKTVTVRGESHSVPLAIQRSLGHTCYHIGQIVQLARHFAGDDWQTLTIPRGGSDQFNQANWGSAGKSHS
jgi:4-hydroxy-2-oxoheptanedioate aldolase